MLHRGSPKNRALIALGDLLVDTAASGAIFYTTQHQNAIASRDRIKGKPRRCRTVATPSSSAIPPAPSSVTILPAPAAYAPLNPWRAVDDLARLSWRACINCSGLFPDCRFVRLLGRGAAPTTSGRMQKLFVHLYRLVVRRLID